MQADDLSADQLCGADCLAYVALRVFGYVNQEADYGCWEELAADRSRLA